MDIANPYNSSEHYAHIKEIEATKDATSGVLDGITIFRFAHMWKNTSSGGVESYLRNLNSQLLQRNKLIILQMYLTQESGPSNIEIERIGRGELVWIPSFQRINAEAQTSKVLRLWLRLIQQFTHRYDISHDVLISTLSYYQPSLAIFHWISGDSRIVFRYLNKRHIPFVVINHFENARLNRRGIRKQVSKALAIGGVSNIDVPDFVRSRFANLSDGVDTDFFHPGKAVSPGIKIEAPLILLPSRIIEGKGHLDAIKALCLLENRGIKAVFLFAGITQSKSLFGTLERTILEAGLRERVIFAGALSPEELRNWYAASSLVVLPSYSEGLGKVLLEAQAMERTAVAYNIGGISEAIRHLETGYLVKPGDIDELATRIKDLLEEPDMRRKMGERGRKFVIEHFSIKSLTIRHEEFYANVLSQSA